MTLASTRSHGVSRRGRRHSAKDSTNRPKPEYLVGSDQPTPLQALVPDEGAVLAAHIFEDECIIGTRDSRVPARHSRRVHPHVGIAVATNHILSWQKRKLGV